MLIHSILFEYGGETDNTITEDRNGKHCHGNPDAYLGHNRTTRALSHHPTSLSYNNLRYYPFLSITFSII